MIERHRPVAVFDEGFQPLELKRLQFFPVHAFHLGIPNGFGHDCTPFSNLEDLCPPSAGPTARYARGVLFHFTPDRDNCKAGHTHFAEISQETSDETNIPLPFKSKIK